MRLIIIFFLGSSNNLLEGNVSQVSSQSSSQSHDPSNIWDKHLLWPSTGFCENKKKKETEKLPYVLTSAEYREYHLKKKNEKEQKELEAQEKAMQRKIKKEESEIKKQKLKEERQKKKDERARINEEKLKLKQEKIEEKLKNKNEKSSSKQQQEVENPINLKRKSRSSIQKASKKTKPLGAIDINVQNNIDILTMSFNNPIDLTINK